MFSNIEIRGTGLGSFVLKSLLEHRSTLNYSWQWFQEKTFLPIYLSDNIYHTIYSITPQINSLIDTYPVYFNWTKKTAKRVWKYWLKSEKRWYSFSSNTLVASTNSSENYPYLNYYNLPDLKFYELDFILDKWYYEYFDWESFPCYQFSLWTNWCYVAWYNTSDILRHFPNLEINVLWLEKLSIKTWVTLIDENSFNDETLFFASAFWITPFMLWFWNTIACIDAILVYLYIIHQDNNYKKLLYLYRKKVAKSISLHLQRNPYTLSDTYTERYLQTFLTHLVWKLCTK